MWGLAVVLFLAAGAVLALLLAALVHHARFHARAVPAPARVVRYDRRMTAEGESSAVLRHFAILTFLDAAGSVIVSEDREPWEGALLPAGSELTAYYDPYDPRQVQTRLPCRRDYLVWVLLVLLFPGGFTAVGVLLLRLGR